MKTVRESRATIFSHYLQQSSQITHAIYWWICRGILTAPNDHPGERPRGCGTLTVLSGHGSEAFEQWWHVWSRIGSIISHVRQIQAQGASLLLSCSLASWLVVMCNLSSFRIHLTFLLSRHRPKDRFVCAGHLWNLADTYNAAIEQFWGPCSTSPGSHLLAALHHNLETPLARQGGYANRNCWDTCFRYEF